MKFVPFFLGFCAVLQKLIHKEGFPVHLHTFLASLYHEMTVTGTSSFRHLRNNLQAKTCVVNLTSWSLMLFTSRPCFPLNVSYLSLMVSERAHSPILRNNKDESSPAFLNPVMRATSIVSIETGGSSQSVPPWMQLSNTLTHALISLLHPKCGISNNLRIPTFSKPDAHSCASTLVFPVPRVGLCA
jgi:hypothetical protein